MSNRISEFNHRRIQSIDELLDRLSNVKAYPGGFSADCPADGHQTPERHLSVKHAGDKALVFCQGGRHGYQDIINGLNLDSLNYMESNKPIPSVSLNDEDAMALLIRTYGLSEATTTHFNITPGKTRQAWQYPVQAGTRYKSYDRKPPNKYCHSEGTPNQLYGFIDVPESTTEIFLVNGEPSVWVCHQANIPAICGLFGEGNLPEDTTSQLEAIGVEVINVVLDLDDAGRKAADKVVSEIKGNFKVRFFNFRLNSVSTVMFVICICGMALIMTPLGRRWQTYLKQMSRRYGLPVGKMLAASNRLRRGAHRWQINLWN